LIAAGVLVVSPGRVPRSVSEYVSAADVAETNARKIDSAVPGYGRKRTWGRKKSMAAFT